MSRVGAILHISCRETRVVHAMRIDGGRTIVFFGDATARPPERR